MTRRGPLCSSGKRWTPDEDAVLRDAASRIRFNQMGRLLPGRSYRSVRARLIELGLYRATARNAGTYTLMEVSRILGVPWGTVREWVDVGKLKHERVPSLKVQTGRGGRIVIADADLDAFITEYPFLFSLETFPEGPHKATLIMARPQDWLNRQQAARALGMCPPHLTDVVRAGRLACRRFGHPVFFHRDEINRYLHDRAHRMMQDPGYRKRWANRHRWANRKRVGALQKEAS